MRKARPSIARRLGPAALIGTLALPLVLAACTPTQSRQVVENETAQDGYPQRLQFGGISLPTDTAPQQPEGGEWRIAGNTLQFGLPGQLPMLAMHCGRADDGAALIHFSRATRADVGAKALFALIGNGRIARLPVDAVRGGENGEWQGSLPARDPRLAVLEGGNRIEATLPGGGTLKLPASREPGRLLASCRATDRTPPENANPA